MQEAAGLNMTSTIYKIDSESLLKLLGSPTKKAILSWAIFDLSMNINEICNPCLSR
jgi:Ca2+-transporting ATPase